MRRQFIAALPLLALVLTLTQAGVSAQEKPAAPQPQSQPAPAAASASSPSSGPTSRPTSGAAEPAQISLSRAIDLARANSTVYQAALTEAGSAHEDRTQARDALLPQVA